MLVFKIVLIGIAGAILVMITKQFKPEYSIPVLLGMCAFSDRVSDNWIRGSFKICAEFTKRNTDK